jgi:hypothetical protein
VSGFTLEPEFTPEPTATLEPIVQPTPAGGGSELPVFSFGPNHCTSADPDLEPPQFNRYPQIARRSLIFLNAGGQPEALFTAIGQSGLLAATPILANADIDGDTDLDLVMSLYDLANENIAPSGNLYVFRCGDDGFETVLDWSPAESRNGGPHLYRIQDLNDDGVAELLFGEEHCGAHTCFEQAHLLSWSGSEFIPRLVGASDDLPYPTILVSDYDQDAVFSVEVSGSGYGSAGAGPQRTRTRVWDFQGADGTWQIADEYEGPAAFRLHVLHDADAALYRGEHAVAISLYRRVAEDPSFTDWVDPALEQATLAAFARYRLVTVYAIQDDTAAIQGVMHTMLTTYPESSGQYVFTEMALLFLSEFQNGIPQACAAAAAHADANVDTVLDFLGGLYWGYANKVYEGADMCPVLDT